MIIFVLAVMVRVQLQRIFRVKGRFQRGYLMRDKTGLCSLERLYL